jgi:hypothetical protein
MPPESRRAHCGPRASAGSHTSPARSPPRRAVPAAAWPPPGPHGRECWECPAGARPHSASGCTPVEPVPVDTSSSSAPRGAPPAAPRVPTLQSPQTCTYRVPVLPRWLSPARRHAPGCPVGAPCRRGRRRESADRSWLAGRAPVAGPGCMLGFLVSPQSPSLSCRGRVLESGPFPPAAFAAFRGTTAPSDSSRGRGTSTAVLCTALWAPPTPREVSRVQRVPVTACRPCYPGGAPRCTG